MTPCTCTGLLFLQGLPHPTGGLQPAHVQGACWGGLRHPFCPLHEGEQAYLLVIKLFVYFPLVSLPPFIPPFFPSLPPSLLPSHPPSLLPYLPPSLLPSFPPSLSHLIKCAKSVLLNKIVSNDKDLVGIVFFGTVSPLLSPYIQ